MDTTAPLAGRYRLGPLIGSGGMADVHRATDELLGREVAIKLLRSRDTAQVDRDRVASEARTVAALCHPGIVTLFDAGFDAGLDDVRPFLVMELVDGPTLSARLADGPMEPEQVRVIGRQIAAALAFAHAQRVVHRDVKPGNVLLRSDGSACLADFGIALVGDATIEAALSGQVMGSPAYVAPEQVAAETVGPAADVYSLGLVLLEALTGRRAFRGTGVEVAYARLHGSPELPVSLGGRWLSTLSAMTALAPHDRPAAAQVVDMLAVAPAYDEVETVGFEPTWTSSARGRSGASWVAGPTAALAVLALLVFLLWPGGHATAPLGVRPDAPSPAPRTAATHSTQAPRTALTHRIARTAPRPAVHHRPPPAHHKPSKRKHGKGHLKH